MKEMKTCGLLLSYLMIYTIAEGIPFPCPYQLYPLIGEIGQRCCKPIVCEKGMEAVMCHEGDPESSSCRPCAHNQYRSSISKLGNHDNCRYKSRCIEPHMYVKVLGNETHDNICGCFEGYKMSANGLNCYPKSLPTDPSKETTTLMTYNTTEHITSTVQDGNSSEVTDTVLLVIAIFLIIAALIFGIFLGWKFKQRHMHKQTNFTEEEMSLINKSPRQLMKRIEDYNFHSKALQTVVFAEISENIATDLDRFSRTLFATTDMPENELQNIMADNSGRSVIDRCDAILKKWNQMMGHKARVEHVLLALEKTRKKQLIDDICQKISQDHNLSLWLHGAQSGDIPQEVEPASQPLSDRSSEYGTGSEATEGTPVLSHHTALPHGQEVIEYGPDTDLSQIAGTVYKTPSERQAQP